LINIDLFIDGHCIPDSIQPHLNLSLWTRLTENDFDAILSAVW